MPKRLVIAAVRFIYGANGQKNFIMYLFADGVITFSIFEEVAINDD